jgi:hypothetical protein
MSTRIPYLLGGLFLLGALPGAAQDTSQAAKTRDAILRVFRLPQTTTEARQRGVPDSSIWSVVDVLRRGQVPADDAQEVIEREVEATEQGQPAGNFGAFVQEQHRRGLRGRALAAAIHAEQARRGMGHRGEQGEAGRPRGRIEDARSQHDTAKATPRGKRGGRPDSSGGRPRPQGNRP